jgi:hypothetical protein
MNIKTNLQANIVIIYIATSIYKEYFKKYFVNTVTNLFPNDNKTLILISDGLNEYNNKTLDEHTKIEQYDIIDFPYPIINLCKFQIVEKYLSKHPEANILLYFDADTLIYEKDNVFWENLKFNIIKQYPKKMFFSYHPHYLYNKDFNFGQTYFFPQIGETYLDNCHNIIMEKQCYIMTSFFMCNTSVIHYFSERIYNMSKLDLKNFRRIPELSDETYINIINLQDNILDNKNNIYLENYITINPYIYGNYPEKQIDDIYINNFPEINSIFINQKFDIKLKEEKR